ncbi:hypothetical protein PUNSTDRAFT_106087 [Punctularia strigosozonata HHB-11173 SS5]|uniref:uncharacterized protein n=1 Tax=Punctularia strigosozonata (strain HHB-11173) TaxID=741275 RepID=UPI0004417AC0|nr:uncharacterized protein PUNSTDRAFT_106087 [Punctularia strigosozonata HHB-11173 SS5]EIN05957.1 hypothetical protein PUNSTDRAFT_106087 [Punctularia strigosozonata HHB-11173 SS5]
MADPAGSNQANAPNSSTGAGPSSKAIPSLAKKQGDVTRLGTQKMKFVPTLPARRKKEGDVIQESEAPKTTSAHSERGRGRGRGRDGDAGRGRGAAPRPAVEMTASGPFAMGPAMSGSSARRSAPRSNFAPIVPLPGGPSAGAATGAGLTGSAGPSLVKQESAGDAPKVESGREKPSSQDEEVEVYSDPDEGVEIVDMNDVRRMDWMAPESLAKEKARSKKKKKSNVVKKEEHDAVKIPGVPRSPSASAEPEAEPEGVNLANAVDLSESEDEEELEDLIDDFALHAEIMDDDTGIRQERLYFFQFPAPFPTFLPKPSKPAAKPEDAMDVDAEPSPPPAKDKGKGKAVSFAEDTKPPASTPSTSTKSTPEPSQDKKPEQQRVITDGVIGQLEVHRSGAVKMRLGSGVVLDVIAATQPSFLQHAVHLDVAKKRVCVLGEVNKRYVVSPDVDLLLQDMEKKEQGLDEELEPGLEGLIKMDAS